jgi:hypothetical protein
MTARTAKAEIFVANSSGICKVDGTIFSYTRGRTRVHSDHPLMRAIPHRFDIDTGAEGAPDSRTA